jgi:hypothetical protein
MALEFKCPSCDEDISVRHLSVGDLVECQKCRDHVTIPQDAVTTSDSEEEALLEDALDPGIEEDTDIDDEIVAPTGRSSKVFTAFALLLAIGFVVFVLVYAFIHFSGENRKIVRSTNDQVQVAVPRSWIRQPKLHSDATLAVGNKSKELYLIVLSENKSAFPDINLEKYAQKTKDNLISNLKSPYTSVRRELIIHNNRAIQYEIRGIREGVEVAYLHISVEHSQNYYQILAWTLRSRFRSKKDLLQQVIQSFQATPPESLWKIE